MHEDTHARLPLHRSDMTVNERNTLVVGVSAVIEGKCWMMPGTWLGDWPGRYYGGVGSRIFLILRGDEVGIFMGIVVAGGSCNLKIVPLPSNRRHSGGRCCSPPGVHKESL